MSHEIQVKIYHNSQNALRGNSGSFKSFAISSLLPSLIERSWPLIQAGANDLYQALSSAVAGFM